MELNETKLLAIMILGVFFVLQFFIKINNHTDSNFEKKHLNLAIFGLFVSIGLGILGIIISSLSFLMILSS